MFLIPAQQASLHIHLCKQITNTHFMVTAQRSCTVSIYVNLLFSFLFHRRLKVISPGKHTLKIFCHTADFKPLKVSFIGIQRENVNSCWVNTCWFRREWHRQTIEVISVVCLLLCSPEHGGTLVRTVFVLHLSSPSFLPSLFYNLVYSFLPELPLMGKAWTTCVCVMCV